MELPIRVFLINGIDSYIELFLTDSFSYPNNTSITGGYDVKGKLSIKTGSYAINNGDLWFSTGEIYRFYKQLQLCYDKIEGIALFETFEHDFNLRLVCNPKNGQILITGKYKERPDIDNELIFEIKTDQTQILEALKSLKEIYSIFGEEKGIKG